MARQRVRGIQVIMPHAGTVASYALRGRAGFEPHGVLPGKKSAGRRAVV
jgi:hypothetical protein